MTSLTIESIQQQITAMVLEKHGRVHEQLISSGIIDSIAAVELAIDLGNVFEVNTDSLALSDLASISGLSKRIYQIQQSAA